METLTRLKPRLCHAGRTLLVVLAVYVSNQIPQCIYNAYRVRTRYHNIPSLPRHLIWGNLISGGERLRPSLKRRPDYGFEEIWQEFEPGCFLVDLAVVEDRGFLIIAEPQYVEALVNSTEDFKYSIPKSRGEAWRALCKRFNPSFQPKYIHSLTGSILSRAEIIVEGLQSLAKSGITFKMAGYAQDLTTDIITQLTIAQKFNAQSTPERYGEKSRTSLLTASRRLSEMVYSVGQGIGFHLIDRIRPLKALFYESIIDHKLTTIVKARINSIDGASESKSIIQLAVSGLPPNKALIRSCVDQVKSFLFAGQDTTATLIQWICYEMSKASHSPHHATILSRLHQEHDTVFGPHPFSALQTLSSPATSESESILTSKLPYTTAFMKETLRLRPPAATVRAVPWEATSLSSYLHRRLADIPLTTLDPA